MSDDHTLEDEVDALHDMIHELVDEGRSVAAIGLPVDSLCVQHGITEICGVMLYVTPESELQHVFDGL